MKPTPYPRPDQKRSLLRRQGIYWLPFVILACLVELSVAQQTPTVNHAAEPTLRHVETNGIRMRIAEQGQGPLVLFLHGFPELWYSWRHQLGVLSEAGYHAVAPDLRGFGGSDAPPDVDDYNMINLCGDVVGLLDALGEETAVLVGHDWGAAVAWYCVQLEPERFTGLVAMSVPYGGRGAQPPLPQLRAAYGDKFFYMLYFQEPGVAEAEFDPNPSAVFRHFFSSPGVPRHPPKITNPRADAGGFLGRIGLPKERPPWFSQEDLDYYVAEYTRTGFRGGLNYYRNFDRNWELTPHLVGEKIVVPVLFVAGEQDLVIRGRSREQLTQMMEGVVPDFQGVVLVPNTGHWLQQERADTINGLLLGFLASL